ncbi:hypothetical protein AB8O38_12080 [Saccharomonospora xinjiangensis]|uniref:hypothetical protein n=1 Tax=Saccharomonospora xinjiangensis TaxID=75294 RepID=UPI00350ED013
MTGPPPEVTAGPDVADVPPRTSGTDEVPVPTELGAVPLSMVTAAPVEDRVV